MIAPAPEVAQRIRELEPWFHDLELAGVRTAPHHPLGDFLNELWMVIEPALPGDMTGMTALDIGCNAGYYSLKLHQRGARVTGVDHDEHYLRQARFAASTLGADIEYLRMDAYDVERLERQFDYVLFMGVLYHLRYPLLALDRIAPLARERLIVQTMVRGRPGSTRLAADYPISEREIFEDPLAPAMFFVENSYAGDPTNWWIPNESGLEAMLRSAGLHIDAHPAREVYFCSPAASRGAA